jgi:peptidoglycan/LPS O-acetylase OafA/YrhL
MKRIIELDGLRGVFSLGVVLYHVRHDWLYWYWAPMDWFFVMSGFVITANLMQNRRAGNLLSMFLTRRCLRIWPLYYLALVAGLLILLVGTQLAVWGVPRSSSWLQQAVFMQYIEGYWHQPLNVDAYPFYLRHLWSLAVEEQFYVGWALLFVAFRNTRWIVPATAAVFVVIGYVSHRQHLHLYVLAHHLHAFGAGLLLAWLFLGEQSQRIRPWLPKLFGACAAISVPLWLPYVIEGYQLLATGGDPFMRRDGSSKSGFTLLWFALIGSVALFPGARLSSFLRQRVWMYLGEMSYSLYLVHYPCIVLLGFYARRHGYDALPFTALGGVLGIIGGHLLHRAIERPLLARKVNLRYRYDAPSSSANRLATSEGTP